MKNATLNIILLLSFLNIYSQGTIYHVPMDFDPIHPRINSLVKNENNLLLIGSSNGLYQYDGYNLDHLIKQPQIPDIRISALFPLKDNNILVGTRLGAYLYRGKSKSIDTLIRSKEITYISETNSKEVFLGTRRFEIFYFNKETEQIQSLGTLNGFEPKNEKIERIEGSLDNIQITVTNLSTLTSKRIILNHPNPKNTQNFYSLQNTPRNFHALFNNILQIKDLEEYIQHLEGTPYNREYNYKTQDKKIIRITSILKESEHFFWIGTADGLYKFRTPLKGINKMLWGKSRGITKDESGTIYSCIPNNIITIKNGIINHIPWPKNINSRPYSFLELKQGNMVVGSEGNGLFQIEKNKTITPFYLGGKNLKGQSILNAISTTDENFWFATQDGIHFYNTMTQQWHELSLGYKIYNLIEAPYHSVYAATKKGLLHIQLENDRLESSQLLSNKYKIRDFTKMGNLMFLATEENGILIYNFKTKEVQSIGVREGLNSKTFYNIVLQGEHLYAGSYDGLYQIDIKTNEFYKINKDDGLSDLEFNTNSKLILNNSEILLGTQNGLTLINTRNLKKDQNDFKSYIHHISYVDKKGISSQIDNLNIKNKITFPTDSHQIIFYLSNSSYEYPKLYKYYVQFDRESIYKLSEENKITFPFLPPGKYEMNILGLNDRYTWSSNSINLNFEVEEPFVKSNYFKLLIGLIVLLLFIAIYSNKKRYQNLIIKTKDEFTANLHDEIGGDLIAIKLKSEMIKVHATAEIKQELNAISQMVHNTILNTSDLIWSIRLQDRKLESLITRMEKLAELRFKGSEFNYLFHTKNSNLGLNLKPEYLQHLYLIYKESLVNFMKYSNFKTFDFLISTQQGGIQIIISQVGDEISIVKESSSYGGHGIRNMITRTKKMHGTISFVKDSNWTIKINIPKP